MQHNLELGDEVRLDSHAPYLRLFDPISPVPTLVSAKADVRSGRALGSHILANGSDSGEDKRSRS